MDFFTTGTRAIISLERSLTLGSIEEAEGRILARGRRETLLEKAGSSIRHTWSETCGAEQY